MKNYAAKIASIKIIENAKHKRTEAMANTVFRKSCSNAEISNLVSSIPYISKQYNSDHGKKVAINVAIIANS